MDERNSLKLQDGNRYNNEPVFSNLRLTQAGESRLFASYEIKTLRKDRHVMGRFCVFWSAVLLFILGNGRIGVRKRE